MEATSSWPDPPPSSSDIVSLKMESGLQILVVSIFGQAFSREFAVHFIVEKVEEAAAALAIAARFKNVLVKFIMFEFMNKEDEGSNTY
jgi:hypothetical protein